MSSDEEYIDPYELSAVIGVEIEDPYDPFEEGIKGRDAFNPKEKDLYPKGNEGNIFYPYRADYRCKSPFCFFPLGHSRAPIFFRDRYSRNEWRISGMCQFCQDKAFQD